MLWGLIDEKTSDKYKKTFGNIGVNYCYGRALVYHCNKTNKDYSLSNLANEELVRIIDKSVKDNKDYLLDMVKDKECPPYKYQKGVLY